MRFVMDPTVSVVVAKFRVHNGAVPSEAIRLAADAPTGRRSELSPNLHRACLNGQNSYPHVALLSMRERTNHCAMPKRWLVTDT